MEPPHAIMPLVTGKKYVFYNHQAGTALDLDVGSNTVQGWTYHGGPNQQVKFITFAPLYLNPVMCSGQSSVTSMKAGHSGPSRTSRQALSLPITPLLGMERGSYVLTSLPVGSFHRWTVTKPTGQPVSIFQMYVLILSLGSMFYTLKNVLILRVAETLQMVLLSSCGLAGVVTIRNGKLREFKPRLLYLNINCNTC